MELLVVLNDLPRPMQRVLQLKELRDDRSHALTVFAEDGLEDSEVELGHLEHSLIKDLRQLLIIVLDDVEGGRLERLNHHVIPVDYFLRQHH